MKRNALLDQCRKQFITPEIKRRVDICVEVSNRIYAILERKNMSQRDLAHRLGKTEAEVSRWLSGTHNLTVSTIAKIEAALGEPILFTEKESGYSKVVFQPMSLVIITQANTSIENNKCNIKYNDYATTISRTQIPS
ncbi:MAG: helix-turn-helix transcriptional regulator [Bacteroides sp.]|nr:helix-turn-helix transcriptional regulator [Bacteroides sp.]